MHHVKVLVKGKDRCTLLIHPDDAEASDLLDGRLAKVSRGQRNPRRGGARLMWLNQSAP